VGSAGAARDAHDDLRGHRREGCKTTPVQPGSGGEGRGLLGGTSGPDSAPASNLVAEARDVSAAEASLRGARAAAGAGVATHGVPRRAAGSGPAAHPEP